VLVSYLDHVDAPEIDYRAELPPHRQIAGWIAARIESGELQPGQPIDSEKDLMDTFGVARTTVRRAIAYLRETGAVRTVPGRGSYVAERG
jgi:DNA-binding GntR family transcriptional regulator